MLTIYLDTSDYSSMANPKRLSAEPRLQSTKDELIKFAKRDDVIFLFSGITIAETMPLRSEDKESCLRTVDLLRELCRDNCLINWDRLIKSELEYLCGWSDEKPNPITCGANWIPGINKTKHLINSQINDLRWAVGSFETDRDIAKHYKRNARDLGKAVAGHTKKFISFEQGKPKPPNRTFWEQTTDTMLNNLALEFANMFHIKPSEKIRKIEISDIKCKCPGITTLIISQMELIWTYVGGDAKKVIQESAYPDSMHGMYAPYVDIFRPDQSMTPHIKRTLIGSDTRVVNKLFELPATIHNFLQSK